jgi:hypothetical protein
MKRSGSLGVVRAPSGSAEVGCALERTRDAPLPPLRTGARTACAQVRQRAVKNSAGARIHVPETTTLDREKFLFLSIYFPLFNFQK